MKRYEYMVASPSIRDDKFIDGYTNETTKGIFGKEKTVCKYKTINETEWLNRKGREGWELVSTLRNSMSYNLREYYFKRETNELDKEEKL